MSQDSFKVKKSLVLTPIAQPTSPQDGEVYYDSTQNAIFQYVNGVWQHIGSGSGGSKNYLSGVANGNFETNTTTGWSLFNTTITNKIPTGSITAGASDFTTFATTGSSPLAGLYSLLTSAATALTAGQGFITDAFTIDREDQATILQISAHYEVVSGSPSMSQDENNTLAVYIYDVTNSAWIQPVGVYSMNGSGLISASFQSTANSTQYRLAIVCVNNLGSAVSIKWDDFSVGPVTSTNIGSVVAVTAISSGGETIGSGTPTAFTNWQIESSTGSDLDASGLFTAPEAGWYQISATMSVDLPSGSPMAGCYIELHKNGSPIAIGSISNVLSTYTSFISTSFNINRLVQLNAGDTLQPKIVHNTGASRQSTGSGEYNHLSIHKANPALGLSSNAVVSMATNGIPSGSPSNSFNTVIYPAPFQDTNAAYSSGVWTCPVTGYYNIAAGVNITGGSIAVGDVNVILLLLNGTTGLATSYSRAVVNNGNGPQPVSAEALGIHLNAGDTIEVQANTSIGSPYFAAGFSNSENYFYIVSANGPGPATAYNNQQVVMRAYQNSNQNITDSVVTTVIFNASTIDDLSIYNASTGDITIPVTGRYQVNSRILTDNVSWSAGNVIQLQIWKNAGLYSVLGDLRTASSTTLNLGANGSDIVDCVAGDVLRIRVLIARGANTSLVADGSANYVSLSRIN